MEGYVFKGHEAYFREKGDCMKQVIVIAMCAFLFCACSDNRKLKPPKKSPCACNVVIDMEQIHV